MNTVDELADGAEVLGVQVNVIPVVDGLILTCIECKAAAPRGRWRLLRSRSDSQLG